jgi:putative thymidine phosphorylase
MIKLKAKKIDISTGEILIALINDLDARDLDLYKGDRIKIKSNKKETIAIVDTTKSSHYVPKGSIGLFDELSNELNVKNNENLKIQYETKPKSIFYIKKKLKGEKLDYHEIHSIVKDIVDNKLTDIELTYFVASTYIHELTIKETVDLTNSIINTGRSLKLKKNPIVDKHCIGGVAGNRTTMVVVPLVAAAGLTIPKTSSRSITSPAGTADTMEVMCNVSFTLEKLKKIISKTNACMVWGGAVNLAPADDKIIRVEHPVSLDPVGQLLASILAKKKSVSATHLLIDIPVGKGAKIEKKSDAEKLKKRFEIIGKKLGLCMKVVITDGRQPIGDGIGPSLEAIDVLRVLRNDDNAPKDLKEKSIKLAGEILELSKKVKKGYGHKMAKDLLESGMGYKKMVEIIKAQGGKITKPEQIKIGKLKHDMKANNDGKVKEINGKIIAKIAKIAGAPKDQGAGISLYVHLGDKVNKESVLYTIYSESKEKLNFAVNLANELNKGIIIK